MRDPLAVQEGGLSTTLALSALPQVYRRACSRKTIRTCEALPNLSTLLTEMLKPRA